MSAPASTSLARPTAEARSVSELVILARRGGLRVPRFQRGFRWDERDVTKLFDSVRRGFPIGSLLLWERAAPAGPARFGSLEVAGAEDASALWVVDGQHRLTALVATLTPHEHPDPPFELYVDLASGLFVRRGGHKNVPSHWLPLDVLLDTNHLLDRLLELRAEGVGAAEMDTARELATTIAEYKIPLAVVKDADERTLREIFHRMNSAGRRMTAPEVFRALHAALEPGDPGDLRTLIDAVNSVGFGPLREDTILRCVLGVRGGDVYRAFEDEFADGESAVAAFEQAEAALRHVFTFLRDDASIPHIRALPYAGVLPILTRFFALHPNPQPRTRNLLRRWIWRGSVAWGRDVGALRTAVQRVTDNEQASVDALLGHLGDQPPPAIDLDAVQLNKAATRMNVALLHSLHPIDLRTGAAVETAALLEDEAANALFEVVPGGDPRLGGRLLHEELEGIELAEVLGTAGEQVLASHAISRSAVDAYLAGDGARFATLRGEELAVRLEAQRDRLAEPAADDRPPLSALVLEDP